MWGSFFVSAFSFFFTTRPSRALVLIVLYLSVGVLGNRLIDREIFPQWIEFIAVIAFIFAPMLLNAGLIIVHESSLGKSSQNKKGQILSLFEELLAFFQ